MDADAVRVGVKDLGDGFDGRVFDDVLFGVGLFSPVGHGLAAICVEFMGIPAEGVVIGLTQRGEGEADGMGLDSAGLPTRAMYSMDLTRQPSFTFRILEFPTATNMARRSEAAM